MALGFLEARSPGSHLVHDRRGQSSAERRMNLRLSSTRLVPKLHSERVNRYRQRSARSVDRRSPTDLPRSLISSRGPDRMTGYDLTFSAPIAVSLLFTPRSRR